MKLETTPLRRYIMSRIRGKGSKEEILLAKELWHRGHRYRKNNRQIKGTPDISFKKYRLAVFVDGEFWHGYDWENRKQKLKNNADFWIRKIERNIERDKEVDDYLRQNGWIVLRFWSAQIKKSLDDVIAEIESYLK